MNFRSRLLVGFLAVVLVPLAVFGLGIRRGLAARLTAQYERRMADLVGGIRAEFDRQGADIAGRLAALKQVMVADNRLRAAALQGGDRAYLLDYAGDAMRLSGLDMLQLQDESGRILTSGHFRNEFDRLEPALPRLLAAAPGGTALMWARTAEAPFLTLARVDSLRLGGRHFTVVGGLVADSAFFARLTRDADVKVALGGEGTAPPPLDTTDALASELLYPSVAPDSAQLVPAHIRVTRSLGDLAALRASVDRWFLAAVGATAVIALLLASWLSARISRPLTALAAKTAEIDMDRLDVAFESDRTDEVGALERLLGAMTERLRAGAARLREVERRLAMGDLARQVNHDIKNGLIPIRNVFRHLAETARGRPDDLPAVFAERQGNVESSIAYLEGLAGNYARLYPRPATERCDANAVARETVRRLGDTGQAGVRLDLAEDLPSARLDPLVLGRILENLVGNAIDALEGSPGTVTVQSERIKGNGDSPGGIRLSVADTGKGMSKQQLDRAFDDFYTTKPGGTGLGLSIVRRLVIDANGALKVETQPEAGSRFIVDLPGWDGAT